MTVQLPVLESSLTDKVLAWLAPRADEMEALLHRLVDIDSNSFDKAGTDAVGEAIADLLKADGIAVSRIRKDKFGDVFRAEVPGQKDNSYALLLGHRDTVFAKGTVTTRGYSRAGRSRLRSRCRRYESRSGHQHLRLARDQRCRRPAVSGGGAVHVG